jgi:inner membrane protein
MRITSHLIVATGAFSVYVAYTERELVSAPFSLFLAYAMVLIGCCLPDIDHPGSTIGRRCQILSYPIRIVFGHRGITHSLLAVVGLWFISYHFNNPFLFWLAFGYAMHLLGDYLTDAGIPALYPSKKRYRFLLVGSTGGISETIMVGLFMTLCSVLIFI